MKIFESADSRFLRLPETIKANAREGCFMYILFLTSYSRFGIAGFFMAFSFSYIANTNLSLQPVYNMRMPILIKKPFVVIFFIIFSLFSINTIGQVRLTPVQVKEILVYNTAGGLGGYTYANIKVVAEDGKWRSYLIHKVVSTMRLGDPYDSVLHRFITVLSPDLINNMLTGIAVIKPAITPATYHLTSHQLITELKNGAKLPIKDAPDFEKLVTQKIINEVVSKTVVDMDVMDDYEYCEVNIITQHNDTVKIHSKNLCPTKLPWTLNGRTTYDMAVNNFVVAAIGKEDVPNKVTLNINYLKESIYKYIDGHNTGAPIATFKWKYYYPGNLKLLTDNFTITERFSYSNVYSCLLRSKVMPLNAVIYSDIDMTSKADAEAVIKYATLIDSYFKTDNFLFNYYSNLADSHISFSYYTGRSPYYSLRYLGKKLPELAKTDSVKVINFWISATDDSSSWLMFPDNKALLTYHSVTTPHGETAPIYPPQDPGVIWYIKSHTYYLFDNTGKVLSTGSGF